MSCTRLAGITPILAGRGGGTGKDGSREFPAQLYTSVSIGLSVMNHGSTKCLCERREARTKKLLCSSLAPFLLRYLVALLELSRGRCSWASKTQTVVCLISVLYSFIVCRIRHNPRTVCTENICHWTAQLRVTICFFGRSGLSQFRLP